jgi:ATP-dependent helicase/nuclease subunit A
MFVVGDEKQSIYSFQGAQPELLIEEFHHHRVQAEAAGQLFERVELHASWRSTPEVLAFVDATFAPPERARAVTPRAAGRDEDRAPILHTATRTGHHGCVDLWPLVKEARGETREAWDAPLDVEGEASANRRLAENIACEIAELTARGDAVFDRESGDWRPASFGDVLILVRKRGALFEEILRALKHARIPVGGADRLALSEHIVFDDLTALARFVLFPADDLTLAALLRSPFCDVEDEGLYALARGRPGSLWTALAARADEDPAWRGALDFLRQAREEAALRRPFEFYARMLGLRDAAGRSMRSRLLRRLGAEAEDALEEFLAQVLAAEQRGVHELESLAADFARLDIVVKRELEGGRDEVRVMTAHGAKGLEAPIVFLPETTSQGSARGSPLMATEDGGFLWCSARSGDCEASRAARELRVRKEAEEADRLLYVALTRARERLVLCGRIAANRNEETLKGWWGAIRTGFEHAAVKPHLREAGCGKVAAIRFGPDPQPLGALARSAAAAAAPPAWTQALAEPETFARYASPSNLGRDDHGQAPSPLAAVAGLGRFRRGDLIHRLLQILPDISSQDRPAAARSLLARERDLTEEQRAEMTAAALTVLDDGRFAQVFGPGSRAEVAIAGQARGLPSGVAISGRIDRLVVLPDRVLVVDFKTNRPSPAAIGEADPAYLRQMAAYAAVLAEVFPDRPIEAALVWTDGPKLMPVPENVLAQALAELGRSG